MLTGKSLFEFSVIPVLAGARLFQVLAHIQCSWIPARLSLSVLEIHKARM